MTLYCHRCERPTHWTVFVGVDAPDRPGCCLRCGNGIPPSPSHPAPIRPDLSNCYAWYPSRKVSRS